MKISYFETARYYTPEPAPREWPVPSGAYRPEAGAEAYHGMIERIRLAERLGFDWVSVSEHHYSPRILTPSPCVSAAFIAAQVPNIKIAYLGPIVPQSNPVRVAEELAMVDTMSGGRLVVGMLRGTTNEYLTFDLNPEEARERTDEGMELILKAWEEPQPFGWQGRHYHFRTVSVWPRPLQQPRPPTYALGTSRESCEFAARHHLGLGVSFAPYEVVGKSTGYYREACARYGWEPTPDDIIYRANIMLTDTDAEAETALKRPAQPPFPMRPAVREALLEIDPRNVAGEKRAANVGGVLPTTFFGSPDTVAKQLKRCREEIGAGIVDLMFHNPGSGGPEFLPGALDMFAEKVLPQVREI